MYNKGMDFFGSSQLLVVVMFTWKVFLKATQQVIKSEAINNA